MSRAGRSRARASAVAAAASQQNGFVAALLTMLDDETHVITWSEEGNSFYVLDAERLSRETLSRHFKSSNFASFVRQLNFYGFRKINNKAGKSGVLEFSHPHFVRGRDDLIALIRRKTATDYSAKSETDLLRAEMMGLRRQHAAALRVMAAAAAALEEHGLPLPAGMTEMLAAFYRPGQEGAVAAAPQGESGRKRPRRADEMGAPVEHVQSCEEEDVEEEEEQGEVTEEEEAMADEEREAAAPLPLTSVLSTDHGSVAAVSSVEVAHASGGDVAMLESGGITPEPMRTSTQRGVSWFSMADDTLHTESTDRGMLPPPLVHIPSSQALHGDLPSPFAGLRHLPSGDINLPDNLFSDIINDADMSAGMSRQLTFASTAQAPPRGLSRVDSFDTNGMGLSCGLPMSSPPPAVAATHTSNASVLAAMIARAVPAPSVPPVAPLASVTPDLARGRASSNSKHRGQGPVTKEHLESALSSLTPSHAASGHASPSASATAHSKVLAPPTFVATEAGHAAPVAVEDSVRGSVARFSEQTLERLLRALLQRAALKAGASASVNAIKGKARTQPAVVGVSSAPPPARVPLAQVCAANPAAVSTQLLADPAELRSALQQCQHVVHVPATPLAAATTLSTAAMQSMRSTSPATSKEDFSGIQHFEDAYGPERALQCLQALPQVRKLMEHFVSIAACAASTAMSAYASSQVQAVAAAAAATYAATSHTSAPEAIKVR